MRIVALSGWGQPHDALAAVAPDATHIDYAECASVEEALKLIAKAAKKHERIIGWSLGGQLAVRAIAKGMLQPKQLVLIGVPFQFVKNEKLPIGVPRDTHDLFRMNYAADPARTLRRAWELIAKDDTRHRQIRMHLGLHDAARVLKKNWLSWLDRLDGFSCADLSFDDFPPTLIVHGRRDAVVWHEQAERFAQAIPGAQLELWEDCGHAPHWHDTEKLRGLIEAHV